jgi:hypothetical protein
MYRTIYRELRRADDNQDVRRVSGSEAGDAGAYEKGNASGSSVERSESLNDNGLVCKRTRNG